MRLFDDKIMTSNTLETKIISTALRPSRVAIFIDNSDKKWKNTIVHLMELLPAIWGGDGFILIPSDGESIHPFFEELLRSYDPDFILKYQRTGYDLKANDPKNFQQIIERAVQEFMIQNPGHAKEIIREHYEKELLRNPLERNFDLSKKIKQYILKDLAIFHHRDDIRIQSITYSGTFPNFLPKFVDIIQHSEKLKNLKIVQLDLKNHAIDFQLMGYGATGKAESLINNFHEKREELEKLLPKIKRHSPDQIAETEIMIQKLQNAVHPQVEKFARSDSSVMFKSVWNRRVDLEGIDFRNIWRSMNNKSKKKNSTDSYDFFTRVPFRVSSVGLSYFFRRTDYLKDEQGNPLVIVGDSVEDYCLYYSLTRLRKKVYWLPYVRLLNDSKKPNAATYSFILATELNHEGSEADNKEIHWTSISLKKSRLLKVPSLMSKNDIVRTANYNGVTGHLVYVDSSKKILPYLLRLYEKKNANNRSAYQFIDGKGINLVDTPRPKSFDGNDILKHKWISEISILDNVYPTADFLSGKVFLPEGIGAFHLNSVATRVSRSGIHYQCPAMGLISPADEVSDSLVRPMLNMIPAKKIFEGYFGRKKYDIRFSDKGSYFRQVLENFKNFDTLIQLIKNKDAFELFKLYIDGSENRSGVFDRGVFLKNEKRRFIDFASIDKLLEAKYQQNSKTETAKLINSLIENNLLERGYIFKCSYCKNSSWYRPDETANNFVCKRCSSQNAIREENLRIQPPGLRFEPLVFYKLNELFYQFWNSNGWITALTLSQLKKGSEGSLIFMPETEFRKHLEQEKPDFEIDLLVILDGNIYFGEAKRDANVNDPNNKLSVSQIERLLGFDEFLPLKGVVFTSFSGNWPDDVLKKFDEIEKKSQFELIKFTAKELG
ncbi:MAG: hypothetical protein RI947_591 [Candidatus Parcubacteria bacterium]|jgi:hypothetical protein